MTAEKRSPTPGPIAGRTPSGAAVAAPGFGWTNFDPAAPAHPRARRGAPRCRSRCGAGPSRRSRPSGAVRRAVLKAAAASVGRGGAGQPSRWRCRQAPPVPRRLPAPRAPRRRSRSHSRSYSPHVRCPPRRACSAAPTWPAPSPALSPPAAPPASWPWWAPALSPPASYSPGTRSARATASVGDTRPGNVRGRQSARAGGAGRGTISAAPAPAPGAGAAAAPRLEPGRRVPEQLTGAARWTLLVHGGKDREALNQARPAPGPRATRGTERPQGLSRVGCWMDPPRLGLLVTGAPAPPAPRTRTPAQPRPGSGPAGTRERESRLSAVRRVCHGPPSRDPRWPGL